MSITIVKPGISTTVQDFGRWGNQSMGQSIGGVMDEVSASIANIICKNDQHAPVIEMTLHGTELLFNEDAFIAFSGFGAEAMADETILPFYKLLFIPAGTLIRMKPKNKGCRSYLAMAGGLQFDEMGSTLQSGDLIKSEDRQDAFKGIERTKQIGISQWKIHFNEQDLLEHSIDAIRGPEWDWLDESAQDEIFTKPFIVSTQSNRMGYRLNEKVRGLKEKKELISTAVTKGIVQLTHEGNPVILMADAQTTGGYPRILRIAPAHIAKLAQCKPGDSIKFNQITEDVSILQSKAQRSLLNKIKSSIDLI
ncbi:MAG: biotin-dependent carboxyltransferase family protein [Bacteroidota bacterium]